MIEFFEFLNTCSPARTLVYLVFIILIVFIIFGGTADIIENIRGKVTIDKASDDKEEVNE